MTKTLDIYIVGVGGQGVLTIAEIISDLAFQKGIPVNYYPTKGMAQRGGFVRAQIRLGHAAAGPSISPGSADLVIAVELSESLKAIRYLKQGGDFALFASRWEPTAVMLGKAPYPSLAAVIDEAEKAGGQVHVLDENDLPEFKGRPVRSNIFVLGMGFSQLKGFFTESELRAELAERWPKAAEQNLFTFRAGLQAAARHSAGETGKVCEKE